MTETVMKIKSIWLPFTTQLHISMGRRSPIHKAIPKPCCPASTLLDVLAMLIVISSSPLANNMVLSWSRTHCPNGCWQAQHLVVTTERQFTGIQKRGIGPGKKIAGFRPGFQMGHAVINVEVPCKTFANFIPAALYCTRSLTEPRERPAPKGRTLSSSNSWQQQQNRCRKKKLTIQEPSWGTPVQEI